MVDNLSVSVDKLSQSLSKIKLESKLESKFVIQEPKKVIQEETKGQRAIRLLRTNLDKNGLTDWNIKISRAVKKLGQCHYANKTISLSSYFIEIGTDAIILNTILHEIAHALCPGDSHGPTWRKKALELGCDGKRCADGVKLDLKYNFECEKGCRVSYTRKCKSVDLLQTGKGKCKKHGAYFTDSKDEE